MFRAAGSASAFLAAFLLAALFTPLLFAATPLGFSPFAATLLTRFLVEPSSLEFTGDAFAADLALEAVDRPVDVAVFDANLDGSELVTSCHGGCLRQIGLNVLPR